MPTWLELILATAPHLATLVYFGIRTKFAVEQLQKDITKQGEKLEQLEREVRDVDKTTAVISERVRQYTPIQGSAVPTAVPPENSARTRTRKRFADDDSDQ